MRGLNWGRGSVVGDAGKSWLPKIPIQMAVMCQIPLREIKKKMSMRLNGIVRAKNWSTSRGQGNYQPMAGTLRRLLKDLSFQWGQCSLCSITESLPSGKASQVRITGQVCRSICFHRDIVLLRQKAAVGSRKDQSQCQNAVCLSSACGLSKYLLCAKSFGT